MITIYDLKNCPYCQNVRNWVAQNLPEVEINYIPVPPKREEREELFKVSGQKFVPTLLDSETNTLIPDDDIKIIEYLQEKFQVTAPISQSLQACAVPWE